ncbi:MAG: fimbrillin family protein [Prevotella sp.]|nr:fimbrillin family protein [Prevotella sp.]
MRKYLFCAMTFVALHVQAQGNHYDVNNDGTISVSDVVTLVNKILGNPDEGNPTNDEQQERKLILQVSENPLTQPNGAKANKRLAPVVFTHTLDHFYINMMYKFYGIQWVKTNRSETLSITTNGYYENNETWPSPSVVGDDDDVYVFGYYTYYKNNVDFFELNDGNPYLLVVTEQSSDDQRDVLVAKKTDTWNNCQGVVNLVFDHVCSALQFSLIKTNSLADYTVEVKEVKLHNVHESGKYALLTDQWYDVSGNSDFTLKAYRDGEENNIVVDAEEETLLAKNESDYLFLIPQAITGMDRGTAIVDADNAKTAYLEIKCKIFKQDNEFKVGSANEYGSVYLPFTATLKAGHIHPFTINMGTSLRDANGNRIFN